MAAMARTWPPSRRLGTGHDRFQGDAHPAGFAEWRLPTGGRPVGSPAVMPGQRAVLTATLMAGCPPVASTTERAGTREPATTPGAFVSGLAIPWVVGGVPICRPGTKGNAPAEWSPFPVEATRLRARPYRLAAPGGPPDRQRAEPADLLGRHPGAVRGADAGRGWTLSQRRDAAGARPTVGVLAESARRGDPGSRRGRRRA